MILPGFLLFTILVSIFLDPSENIIEWARSRKTLIAHGSLIAVSAGSDEIGTQISVAISSLKESFRVVSLTDEMAAKKHRLSGIDAIINVVDHPFSVSDLLKSNSPAVPELYARVKSYHSLNIFLRGIVLVISPAYKSELEFLNSLIFELSDSISTLHTLLPLSLKEDLRIIVVIPTIRSGHIVSPRHILSNSTISMERVVIAGIVGAAEQARAELGPFPVSISTVFSAKHTVGPSRGAAAVRLPKNPPPCHALPPSLLLSSYQTLRAWVKAFVVATMPSTWYTFPPSVEVSEDEACVRDVLHALTSDRPRAVYNR